MEKRNIVVIGASAGGFEVIKRIVQLLPADLDASIFIVWHMSPEVRGILPSLFNGLSTIPVANARDMEPVMSNRIYVAAPDHHMIIEEGIIKLTRGPKENRFRPAVDPLFRSAAYTYGARVIGVILSGALDDGTAGLWRIKTNGGLAIVQDPADADVPSMPESALREVDVDYCVSAHEIPALLVKLTAEEVNGGAMKDQRTKIEIDIASQKNPLLNGAAEIGEFSPFACPECHGVLMKIKDGKFTRFRCHTGHAYSPDTLMMSLSESVEDSLYNAIRGMDESIFLLNHMGDHYAEDNQPAVAGLYFKKAKELLERSKLIRKAVQQNEQLNNDRLLSASENDQ